MTKLLEDAIARVRELPEADQLRAAESLLVFAELARQGIYGLSAEERTAIDTSRAEAVLDGLASDAEVEAAYARFRR